MEEIEIQTYKSKTLIRDYPNICPFCHGKITPNLIFGNKKSRTMDVFMSCPDKLCLRSFVGEYNQLGSNNLYVYANKVTKGNIIRKEFAKTICDISPSFIEIYNQSFYAEQEQLFEICGVGYRKALEFLIKDYSILKNPDKKRIIEVTPLTKCIADYITDSKIISVAKRAVWLGNDETHYVRKWEGKNLEDLKLLIEVSLHWIEMEQLTEKFSDDMPE